MVLLGDAVMHTNPTAGRGVSLAFAHAQHLVSTFDSSAAPAEFTAAFDGWTDANMGVVSASGRCRRVSVSTYGSRRTRRGPSASESHGADPGGHDRTVQAARSGGSTSAAREKSHRITLRSTGGPKCCSCRRRLSCPSG
jgi:hypothetical protein